MTQPSQTLNKELDLVVIIPAAGVGSRMGANKPKQYLPLSGKTILEQTVDKFLSLAFVKQVIIAVSEEDPYFEGLGLRQHPKITVVAGGDERADSVASGIAWAKNAGHKWVMVHDAARPCVLSTDIERLIEYSVSHQTNAILGARAKDTFKRTGLGQTSTHEKIESTVDRNHLWHAFTPQCCKVDELHSALHALTDDVGKLNSKVTDEASALEMNGFAVDILESSPNNIKITVPEDLPLAEFYLQQEQTI